MSKNRDDVLNELFASNDEIGDEAGTPSSDEENDEDEYEVESNVADEIDINDCEQEAEEHAVQQATSYQFMDFSVVDNIAFSNSMNTIYVRGQESVEVLSSTNVPNSSGVVR